MYPKEECSVVERICSIGQQKKNHGSTTTTNNNTEIVAYTIVDFLKERVPTISDPERIVFSSEISSNFSSCDSDDATSLFFLLQHTLIVIHYPAACSKAKPFHDPNRNKSNCRNCLRSPTPTTTIPKLDRFEWGNRQSLSSLVSDVITHLITRKTITRVGSATIAVSKSSSSNVLSAGYGMIPNVGATRLQQIRLNAGSDLCRHSKLFQHLHQTLGDDILRYILVNTSVFVPIVKSSSSSSTTTSTTTTTKSAWNYWQITGPPMTQWIRSCRSGGFGLKENRKRKEISNGDPKQCESQEDNNNNNHHHGKKRKRKKRKRPIPSLLPLQNANHPNHPMDNAYKSVSPLSPSSSISRHSLWYTNSYYTKTIRDGFMEYDSPTTLWHAMTSEYHDNGMASTAHGSCNHQQQLPHQRNNRNRHESGLLPSPEALDMCTELLRRHRTFDYHRTLDRCCPLPPNTNDSASCDIASLGQSFCHTQNQVVPYCVQAVAHVFPSSFWCHSSPSSSQQKKRSSTPITTNTTGINNQSVLLQQTIPTFVTLRRNERMPNKTLMQNLQINRMKWLYSVLGIENRQDNKKKKMNRVDHERLHLLVLSIVRWVFREYLIPLLRTAFYVTDGQEYGKRLLFYRRPVWALFRARSMQKLLGQCSDRQQQQPQVDGKKSQYVELKEHDTIQRLANQQMGLSTLRLLPKATGVRPIAMLRRSEPLLIPLGVFSKNDKTSGKRKWSEFTRKLAEEKEDLRDDDDYEDVESPIGPARLIQKTGRSGFVHQEYNRQVKLIVKATPIPTNAILQDAMAVLNYEVNEKSGSFGAGLPGLHHFFIRYRRFLKQWKSQSDTSNERKRLLFGSVDIHHCYDNINQTHLLKILDTLLTQNDYMVEKFSIMHPRDGMSEICRRHKRIARPLEELVPFSMTTRVLAEQHRGSIFIDGVSTIAVSKQQVLSQVREHLTSHLVVAKGRFRNRYLLQATGIPQVSILSSLLCNIYYGDVERHMLKNIFRDGYHYDTSCSRDMDSLDLLARMIDDFILITTASDNLETFFTTMYQGDSSLGVEVNKEKSRSSVDLQFKNRDGSVEIVQATKSSKRFFPWCGLLFDTMTGEVRNDYSRFYEGKGSDTITIERGNNEGEQLLLQMKLFVRPRCLPIMFDPFINTLQTQAYNFYQMIVFAAVKTSEYLEIWRGNVAKKSSVNSNAPFIVRCAESLVDFSFHLIEGRLMNEFKKESVGESMVALIPQWMATMLGWKAFFDVFIRISHDDMRSLAKQYFGPLVDQWKSDDTPAGLDLEEICATALEDIQLHQLLNSK
jgi:hypothetical protein